MHSGIGNASLPEIVATVSAMGGLLTIWQYTYPRALRSLAGLETLGQNGIAQRAALAVIVGEKVRAFIFGLMIVIGLVLMLLPPATTDGEPSPAAWALMAGFLSIQVSMHLWSITDIRATNDMLRMARARRREEEQHRRETAAQREEIRELKEDAS